MTQLIKREGGRQLQRGTRGELFTFISNVTVSWHHLYLYIKGFGFCSGWISSSRKQLSVLLPRLISLTEVVSCHAPEHGNRVQKRSGHGEDLKEFVGSTQFEAEAITIYSQLAHAEANLQECLTMALEKLSVDHGMPPSTDPWVYGSIVEPLLQSLSAGLNEPISQEIFLKIFKKIVNNIIQRLHEHPVIVAHSENSFDGSAIRRLLSNRFELNKLLDVVWRDLPKDQSVNASKECILFALDRLAISAELPPRVSNDQVDVIVNEVIEMVNVDNIKSMNEQELKKKVSGVLESLSL